MKILMLIAHPLDDILFGYHDIYFNECIIICFTNKRDITRTIEFCNFNLYNNTTGYILDFIDSIKNNWNNMSNEYI
jgi:hypothetical protein